LTALKICLHQYSGSAKVAVGSPARRKSEESSQPANAVTIVTEINEQESIQQLLTNVRQNLLDAYANQTYPFEQLLEAEGEATALLLESPSATGAFLVRGRARARIGARAAAQEDAERAAFLEEP